jgi:iron complex outermembrane receptor protein
MTPQFTSRRIEPSAKLRISVLSVLLIAATSPFFVEATNAPQASTGQSLSQTTPQEQPSQAANAAKTASPAPTGKVVELSPIVVTAKLNPGYSVSNDQTATRTDAPIAETPLSIQVVPQQVIEDQGISRLRDVYRNVSSVAPMHTEGNGIQFETAYIRGFSQLLYVDGVQLYTMPTIDLAGVQQVEVLKGPASSIYGSAEPGGLINVIPKLPELSAYSEASVEVGSYDFYRGEIDTTGPINPQLSYRLEGAVQDNDSFRDYLHQQSEFIAPSLTWNPAPDTRVTTWLWYQHQLRPNDNGVVFTTTGQPVGPISRNLAGMDNNTQYIDDMIYDAKIEHDINSDLTISGKFLMHNFDGHEDAIRWNNVYAANTIAPYYDHSHFNDWQFDFQGDVIYKVELGPTRHEFLFGTELNRNDYHYDRDVDTNLPVINIFAPVAPTGPYPLTAGLAEQHTLTTVEAFYLQDQMDAIDDHLHFLLGGRIDHVDQSYVSFSTGKSYYDEEVGPNGRAGLLYDVTPWLSPYVNIARSFNPNTAGSNLTFSGTPLPPTTGVQYETGLKFAFFDKKLTFSTAAYQITKNDVAVGDPNHVGFSVNGGELRSEGVEFDGTGQITPELQVIASYAYTDTDVLKSTTLPVGASFINIPLNSGSVWLNYTFRSGLLKDFGVGTGVFISSDKAGDNANSFYLPGYTRWDAAAWYSFDLPDKQRLKIQLSAFNLLDTTYYESSQSAGMVEPGAPLSIMGKCSITF